MRFLTTLLARSLRGRLILLTVGVSLITALLVGGIGDFRYRSTSIDAAMDSLANEARLTAQRFKSEYVAMHTSAVVVSRMPPIRGLVRALGNDGADPVDGSTAVQWRARLETIFVSMMAEAPHYTQMRYIGAADGGRELVRVDRKGSRLVRVGQEALQQKGSESYVVDGLKLDDGEVSFSEVTLNREHGRIDASQTPTLRTVVPVRTNDGDVFGLIVVNADYEAFLHRALKELSPDKDTYFVNRSGDYIEYRADGGIGKLEIQDHYSAPPPPFVVDFVKNQVRERAYLDKGFAIARADAAVSSRSERAEFAVVLRVSREQFLAAADAARDETLAGILALTLVAALVAAACADRLVAPLKNIARRLSEQRFSGASFGLPVSRPDEIGEVSRAFEETAAALLQSETKARAVLDTATNGIITIDEVGVMESYNAACERIFGYTADEALGQNVSMLMPSPDKSAHDGYLQRYLGTGVKQIIGIGRELRGRRKCGEVFPLDLSIAETRVGGQRIFTGIVRDISERKTAQAENERLIAKLEESNVELENFAYVASHDLKAPLRAIENTASWLAEDLEDALTGENLENMQYLRGRVRRMDKLLDDLLEYSRIGRKLDPRQCERVDGESLMQDVVTLQNAPERFRIEISPDFAGIEVDRMPLQQIFQNLIGNAIKHHDRSDGRVEVTVEDLGNDFAFTVKDDGPGISPEYHEQVFELFQSLKSRDQVEGSGMGLAVVKKHIRQRNGSIELESDEGAGCAFRIIWPKLSRIGGQNAYLE